jgi:hypothetical protein
MYSLMLAELQEIDDEVLVQMGSGASPRVCLKMVHSWAIMKYYRLTSKTETGSHVGGAKRLKKRILWHALNKYTNLQYSKLGPLMNHFAVVRF